MDRLDAMLVFATAAEEGSLSAAGRKLRMPLATVSRKVADLEAYVKAPLLVRSARKLRLTDAGRCWLATCKRVLEDVDEARRIASGEYETPRGELIVTASIMFGRLHLVPVIAEFLEAYRDVQIRAVLGDRIVNIREDQIDVAVRIGELPDSRLVATRVAEVRTVVCASPAYLAKRGTPKAPAELAAHDCIAFTGLMSSGSWTFGRRRLKTSIRVRPRLTVDTAEAAIDAAMAGVGLTRVLSYQVEQAVRKGALAIVLNAFEPEPLPVSLVYDRHGPVPLKLRAFVDFAIPRLRTRLR